MQFNTELFLSPKILCPSMGLCADTARPTDVSKNRWAAFLAQGGVYVGIHPVLLTVAFPVSANENASNTEHLRCPQPQNSGNNSLPPFESQNKRVCRR